MARPEKILVVDDEADLVELVSYNLDKEGFSVSSASNGEDALKALRGGRFDLVVLDLMLPGIQGLELCRMLKSDPKTSALPIIMLTAKSEEADRVIGLEMGADDYVVKPFSPRELAARVKAVLRRSAGAQERPGTLRIGPLVIDRESMTVTKNGKPIGLSATEFRLLLFLVEGKGKVFGRERLLDAVWKNYAFVGPRTVDVHIRRLRALVEDDPSNPRYVKTKRGFGYYVDENT